MSGLTDFVLARIAEDEADAEGINRHRIYADERWTADRVRADCEAKRRFVREAQDQVSEYFSRFILETLALPYADHPDYRDEWRP